MRVVLTGATGMIGRALTRALRERGDDVVALSRDQRRGRQALGDGVEVVGWERPTSRPAVNGGDQRCRCGGQPDG